MTSTVVDQGARLNGAGDSPPMTRLTVEYWTVDMEGQSSCGSCDVTLTALQEAVATIRPVADRLGLAVDVVPRTVTTWSEAVENAIVASPTIRAGGAELRPAHPDGGTEERVWQWRGQQAGEAPAEALLDFLVQAVGVRSRAIGDYLAAGGPAPYLRRFLREAPAPDAPTMTAGSCSSDAC